MIFNIIINFIILILNTIFLLLPSVTLSSIPLIGTYISSYLTMGVQYFNSFLVTFPYLVIDWQILIYVIVPFEVTMLVAKFFLGSRAPAQHIN